MMTKTIQTTSPAKTLPLIPARMRHFSDTDSQKTHRNCLNKSVGHISIVCRSLMLIFLGSSACAQTDSLNLISNTIRSDPSLQGSELQIEYSGSRTEPVLDCSGNTTVTLPPGQKLTGRVNVQIHCDSPEWSQWQPVLVRRFSPVIMSKETIRRGTPVSSSMVMVQKQDTTWMNAGFFSTPEQIEGATALRDIPANMVLLPGLLGPRLVIHRGDAVIIETGNESLVVRDNGFAENDATLGATVRVRHARSGRVVEGIASGERAVRIPF